jgi:beta-D-xylosidase 4
LFDPISDQTYWKLGEADIGTAASKAMNLKAALASLVLIQNPGVGPGAGTGAVLPLKAGQHIAMIGPHANASMDLIQHDTGAVCPDGANENWNNHGDLQRLFNCIQSPFQAVKEINDKANLGPTTYTQGCDLLDPSTKGFAAALAAAKAADTVILGLGISERVGNLTLETEGHDRTSIDLPEVQKQLAKQVLALGKPTVIFFLNGGMVAMDDFVLSSTQRLNREKSAADGDGASTGAALIEAFYPGKEGAIALAQSVFGQANRWGKMPYTVYEAGWAAKNPMLDHDVTHQRTYRYGAEAVVPFGWGISLSKFELAFGTGSANKMRANKMSANKMSVNKMRANKMSANKMSVNDGAVRLHTQSRDVKEFVIDVTNTGNLAGDEVVMAYFLPVKVALEMHPVKAMFDFVRVSDLAAGASTRVIFSVGADSILLATAAGDIVRAPGNYTLAFENGAGQVLHAKFELVGEQVVVEPFPQVPG